MQHISTDLRVVHDGLAITAEHQALANAVRSYGVSRGLLGRCRELLDDPGADPGPGWKELAGLGWLGLPVRGEYGGQGFGLPELAVVVGELGRFVPAGQFLSAAVTATVLSECGTDVQRQRYLAGVIDGSITVGLDLTSPENRDGGAVIGGRWASLLLLRAGGDLILLPADDDAVTLTPVAGLDPSLGLARVAVQPLPSDAATVLPGATAFAVAVLRILATAEAAGGARACLALALAHAKAREQFGRPIGGFQAVKHHLANLLIDVELATAAGWQAARSGADAGPPEPPEPPRQPPSAVAGVLFALPAYQQAAQKTLQLHGGTGFTWEHDTHLYLRRAVALRAVVEAAGNAADELFALTRSGAGYGYGIDLPEGTERARAEVRAEARAFAQRYRAAPESDRRALLIDSGYLVPHWPRPYGRAAGAVEQLVIEEEFAGLQLPSLGVGGWVLSTLLQTANADQIERWLMPGLRGQTQWCQLFSEPGAGSDAAAIRTRGLRVAGGWRVTGQKLWISGAETGDRGLATVRTDPAAAKHRGITAMAVDLRAPGVRIRPLPEITGEARFSEVFLDDVFVPDDDVVGAVNAGWSVARSAFGNERVGIGDNWRAGLPAAALIGLADRHPRAGDAGDAGDAETHRQIARLVAQSHALRCLNLRRTARAVVGGGPGPEANLSKVYAAELAQRVAELALRIAGPAAVLDDEPKVTFEYLFGRALTIGGGTSEISRNLIAERILGLPREPSPAALP